MNRGTVVLLALAVLLAHTLAIHQTPDGDFAEAYELAHVAFRLGRNLIYEGAAVWNLGGPTVESYPSPLWVLLNAAAARLYVSPILVSQGVGLASALGTVFVLAQFSPGRTAGLIAPLLLAACGSAAAAAASGTETALAMLLLTTAFLAFERGWPRLEALTLAALVLTRPEGAFVVLLFFLFGRFWRPETAPERRRPRWLLLPASLLVLGALLRWSWTGAVLSPFTAPLFELDTDRWRLGFLYLTSFAGASGFGLLFLAVILSTVAGRNTPTGARALTIVCLWWGLLVLSGGDGLPFWISLAPALPLFFLVVQDHLRVWMDERAAMARVAWPLLLVTVAASFLVSKVPGDLGPLRLERPLTRWQTPSDELARAYPRPLGRLGLLEEIRAVEHLRTLGVFLRDRVRADATILTAWPGTIGYLSRKPVFDLTGRAWPLPGRERPISWRGASRVDALQSLTPEVDYIVPIVGTLSENEEPSDFLQLWLEQYDAVGHTEERVRQLLEALGDYVLVAVPVPAESRRPDEPSDHPFPLIARRDIGLTPVLTLETEGDEVVVRMRHDGNQQVVDLCVRATRLGVGEFYLRPTGVWTRARAADARTSLLVFGTGQREVELVRARIPPQLEGARVSAWLHNPGMAPDAPLAVIGQTVRGELPSRNGVEDQPR